MGADEDPVESASTDGDDRRPCGDNAKSKSLITAAPTGTHQDASFDGTWDKGHIRGDTLMYPDGSAMTLRFLTASTCKIEGTDIEGELGTDGVLHWNNDDAWVK